MILWVSLVSAATIEGSLVDVSGLPLVDVGVVAYDQRFRFTTTRTDASGHYTLTELAPNPYRVRAVPMGNSAATESWIGDGGTNDACSASVYELAAGAILEVDGTLSEGKTLRGQLFRYTHEPMVGAEVVVYPVAFRESGILPRSVYTDDNGEFVAPGLVDAGSLEAPGYLVEVADGVVPKQFFRGAWHEQGARAVEIPEHEIDVGAWSTREGVRLEGSLIGAEGPVSGEVHVFAGGRSLIVAAGADGVWAAEALEPGEISVWASAVGYARTHWGDQPTAGDPLLVEQAGETREGVHITLLPEGTLSGRIVGSMDLSGIGLVAVTRDGSIGIGSGVSEDGTFSIAGLSEGLWTLEVYGASEGFVSGVLLEEGGSPRLWTVTASEDTDVGRLEPPRAGMIRGTAYDDATGAPLYGAAVIAERVDTAERRLSFTAVDGTYEVQGLSPGSWSLEVAYAPFCLVDGSWVPLVWPDQPNPALGGTVLLDPDEVFVWDPSLPPDADSDRMDDRWESANGLDPTVDDAEGDPDGDGFTNLAEYRLGTDPNAVYSREGCTCASSSSSAGWLPLVGLLALARRRSHSKASYG